MVDCLNCHQPMPDGATVCPKCGADAEKIRAMLNPSYASSTPPGRPATTASSATYNIPLKKVLILVLLVAVAGGAFWYFWVQNAGFDIDKYKEMVSKAQQGLPLLRQTLNAPGDLVESFQGTPAGELFKVDRKFFQDLKPILAKGVTDCAGVPGEIESLKRQYQRTREPLTRGIKLNQINPLLGLAFMQVFSDQMKAIEPDVESFVAICPRESKALNFLLEKK